MTSSFSTVRTILVCAFPEMRRCLPARPTASHSGSSLPSFFAGVRRRRISCFRNPKRTRLGTRDSSLRSRMTRKKYWCLSLHRLPEEKSAADLAMCGNVALESAKFRPCRFLLKKRRRARQRSAALTLGAGLSPAHPCHRVVAKRCAAQIFASSHCGCRGCSHCRPPRR